MLATFYSSVITFKGNTSCIVNENSSMNLKCNEQRYFSIAKLNDIYNRINILLYHHSKSTNSSSIQQSKKSVTHIFKQISKSTITANNQGK
jgi:hypothetical protein